MSKYYSDHHKNQQILCNKNQPNFVTNKNFGFLKVLLRRVLLRIKRSCQGALRRSTQWLWSDTQPSNGGGGHSTTELIAAQVWTLIVVRELDAGHPANHAEMFLFAIT